MADHTNKINKYKWHLWITKAELFNMDNQWKTARRDRICSEKNYFWRHVSFAGFILKSFVDTGEVWTWLLWDTTQTPHRFSSEHRTSHTIPSGFLQEVKKKKKHIMDLNRPMCQLMPAEAVKSAVSVAANGTAALMPLKQHTWHEIFDIFRT